MKLGVDSEPVLSAEQATEEAGLRWLGRGDWWSWRWSRCGRWLARNLDGIAHLALGRCLDMTSFRPWCVEEL